MWSNMQIYKNKENFNKLLGATAIKTFGDFLQECLACIKLGGYVNSSDQFPDKVKDFLRENSITPIYRSVSEPLKIVPYDENGDALRLGIQGDRPSGFRSIYILMNGDSGINQQSIGGYVYTSANQKPSRSILVSRNETNAMVRKDGLRGKIIYTTRELPIVQEDKLRYLKSLQYKTIRERKDFIDKETKEPTTPEITEPTIEGSSMELGYSLDKPPSDISSLEDPYKTSNYNDWDDYETARVLTEPKNKLQDFLDPQDVAKAEEKVKKIAEKAQEKVEEKARGAAEKERMTAEAQGMRGEERRTKDVLLANKEISEKQTLLAKTLNPTTSTPLDETEKRRLKLLQRKYASSGGKTKKGRKKTIRQKVSHKNKKETKIKNKCTKKHRSVKKNKRSRRG